MALEKGSRVGKYEITSRLGGFGVGEVYRATEARLGREVAVKIIENDVEELKRVETAMSRAITLFHPNIGAILEFNVGSESSYAVLEFYEGESLRHRLGRGRLPWRDCTMIGSDVALGLAAAHERAIAHGNLTPASVLVGFDGRVKILDFGMVATESAAELDAAVEADCRALGKLLCDAATGEALGDRDFDYTVREVRVGLERAGTPESFADVVSLCFQFGDTERRRSAREIALKLRSLLSESGSMMPTVPTKRRHPIWLVGAILLTIAILIGFLLVLVLGADGLPIPYQGPGPISLQ